MNKSRQSPSDSPSNENIIAEAEAARAFNNIAIGIKVLYESAVAGNLLALHKLNTLANQTILFGGRYARRKDDAKS
jgi:hypothetical protein